MTTWVHDSNYADHKGWHLEVDPIRVGLVSTACGTTFAEHSPLVRYDDRLPAVGLRCDACQGLDLGMTQGSVAVGRRCRHVRSRSPRWRRSMGTIHADLNGPVRAWHRSPRLIRNHRPQASSRPAVSTRDILVGRSIKTLEPVDLAARRIATSCGRDTYAQRTLLLCSGLTARQCERRLGLDLRVTGNRG
jgi:hypothetical protein